MKYIRKTIALVLVLLMVWNLGLNTLAAEGDPGITLTVDKTAMNVGDKVTVTIAVDTQIAGIYGIGMKIKADPNVFDVESITTDFASNNKLEEKGWIKLAKTSSSGNDMTLSGTIATIVLTAKAAAETTNISLTDLECTRSGVSDSEKYVSVNTPAAITTSVTTPPPYTGYTIYASADTSTSIGSTAIINIYAGYSGGDVSSYNAYDVTVGYDKEKLSFDETTGYTPADSEDSVSINHDPNAGTIRIAGVGKAKEFAKPIAALTFTMNVPGAAAVEITASQISNQQQAIESDAPASRPQGGNDETPGSTQIKVPFTVQKEDYVLSDDIPQYGESYTFSFADANLYTYEGLSVTMNGSSITPTANEDGSYTISNVSGNIIIEVTRTEKSFAVTFAENTYVTIDGTNTATYGTDYEFTATANTGYRISAVTAAIGETNITADIRNGKYVIPGSSIQGNMHITVATEALTENTTAITITGIDAAKVVGGVHQVAANGQDFDIVLLPEDGYLYTAKIGSTVLGTSVETETGKTTVTVPGIMIDGTALTVVITKIATDLTDLELTVNEYIQLDEKSMFLVTAKYGEAVLAYDGEPMFWSDKYDAYCWLLISDEEMNSLTAAQTAAVQAISVTTETAKELNYDMDINTSGTVDINDAQLVYDMFLAYYDSYDANITMEKFLKADVVGADNIVDTNDAVAIVRTITGEAASE